MLQQSLARLSSAALALGELSLLSHPESNISPWYKDMNYHLCWFPLRVVSQAGVSASQGSLLVVLK